MWSVLIPFLCFVIGVIVGVTVPAVLAQRVSKAYRAANEPSFTTSSDPHPRPRVHPAGSKLARKAAEGRIGRGQPQ